jgi:poly(3-hydroxybutyrate) depolymerase
VLIVEGRASTWIFDGTGHYNLTLPNNRWAWVHVKPYTFNNTKPHPLVIAYHGNGADAQNLEAISNLSNNSLTIDGQDIVTVYAQGTNGPKGTRSFQGAPYADPNVDDVSRLILLLPLGLDSEHRFLCRSPTPRTSSPPFRAP